MWTVLIISAGNFFLHPHIMIHLSVWDFLVLNAHMMIHHGDDLPDNLTDGSPCARSRKICAALTRLMIRIAIKLVQRSLIRQWKACSRLSKLSICGYMMLFNVVSSILNYNSKVLVLRHVLKIALPCTRRLCNRSEIRKSHPGKSMLFKAQYFKRFCALPELLEKNASTTTCPIAYPRTSKFISHISPSSFVCRHSRGGF